MEQEFWVLTIPLVAGYFLDLLLGDPRWLPHPIRLFGNLIIVGEKRLNKGSLRFLKGLLLTIFLCLLVFIFFRITINYLLNFSIYAYYLFSSLFLFYGSANKSLLQEGKDVFNELKTKGIEAGRKRLSWIVGRETKTLSPNQIRTAVFETLSENLSDGVIAPLFYYAVLGLPGMMTYKMINTLDSMIGYKSDRYFYFGKFAARLDDVANYIPARITGLLIALVTLSKRSFKFFYKYGKQHASPNSGYPEAAMAGVLNCRFGGPNVYHGTIVEKPFIGENYREFVHEDFDKASFVNHAVTLLTIVIIILVYGMRHLVTP